MAPEVVVVEEEEAACIGAGVSRIRAGTGSAQFLFIKV